MNKVSHLIAVCSALCLASFGFSQDPVPKSEINQPVLSVVQRSTLVSHADPNKVLHVTISLPYGDPAGMQKFADDVSNPKSPNYRHYITPDEVGARFGLSTDAVNAIERRAAGHR